MTNERLTIGEVAMIDGKKIWDFSENYASVEKADGCLYGVDDI